MVAERRPGHSWAWYDGRDVRAPLRWVEGRAPEESYGETRAVPVRVVECRDCGLLAAYHDRVDAEGRAVRVAAYGFDLDALALRGGAPACEPFALCRPPLALPGEAA